MLELRPFGGNAQASRIPGTIPDVGEQRYCRFSMAFGITHWVVQTMVCADAAIGRELRGRTV
jgi:hypothetical protein